MRESSVTEHRLKIWPEYFDRVLDGSKTFEVRENDRGFLENDIVILREWSSISKYSGRELSFKIGYILPLENRQVVFSLLPINYMEKING